MGAPIDVVRQRGGYGTFGYKAVRAANAEGRNPVSGAGSVHQANDRIQLINQSREFLRNNAIYSGMISRAVAYIVGNGFNLRPISGNKNWDAKAEAGFRRWWRKPEVRNVLSGSQVARMVCRELLTCGDTLALKTSRGRLQLFEAEQLTKKGAGARRVQNDGVDKDEFGTPTKFWLTGYAESGFLNNTSKDAKPEEVLFVTDPERPSSLRGVPPAQSAFPMLHRINDVCDSEAIAWQMLARMAISITRESPPLATEIGAEDPDKTGTDTDDDLTTLLTELDYALIFHGKPGESVEGVERNIPSSNFSESLRTFLRLLGLPLGLPLEVILLDWTKSNYSQSRAVLLQAFMIFLSWQEILEAHFFRPAYEWWVDLAVASGQLKPRATQYEHEWVKPTFPWIDQLKEAQGYAQKLDRGFCSWTSVVKSLNSDPTELRELLKQETVEAIKLAEEIEKETGVKVPWQRFAGLGEGAPAPAPDQQDDDEEGQITDPDEPPPADEDDQDDDEQQRRAA